MHQISLQLPITIVFKTKVDNVSVVGTLEHIYNNCEFIRIVKGPEFAQSKTFDSLCNASSFLLNREFKRSNCYNNWLVENKQDNNNWIPLSKVAKNRKELFYACVQSKMTLSIALQMANKSSGRGIEKQQTPQIPATRTTSVTKVESTTKTSKKRGRKPNVTHKAVAEKSISKRSCQVASKSSRVIKKILQAQQENMDQTTDYDKLFDQMSETEDDSDVDETDDEQDDSEYEDRSDQDQDEEYEDRSADEANKKRKTIAASNNRNLFGGTKRQSKKIKTFDGAVADNLVSATARSLDPAIACPIGLNGQTRPTPTAVENVTSMATQNGGNAKPVDVFNAVPEFLSGYDMYEAWYRKHPDLWKYHIRQLWDALPDKLSKTNVLNLGKVDIARLDVPKSSSIKHKGMDLIFKKDKDCFEKKFLEYKEKWNREKHPEEDDDYIEIDDFLNVPYEVESEKLYNSQFSFGEPPKKNLKEVPFDMWTEWTIKDWLHRPHRANNPEKDDPLLLRITNHRITTGRLADEYYCVFKAYDSDRTMGLWLSCVPVLINKQWEKMVNEFMKTHTCTDVCRTYLGPPLKPAVINYVDEQTAVSTSKSTKK